MTTKVSFWQIDNHGVKQRSSPYSQGNGGDGVATKQDQGGPKGWASPNR